MDADELVREYLRAIGAADLDGVAALFTEGAVVHSPLYGPMPARPFFARLFADTASAELTLRAVMHGTDTSGATMVSFLFHFDWRLPSGVAAPFDVVDVARLSGDGLVEELHLVYDTVAVRPAFEDSTGVPSWRPGG